LKPLIFEHHTAGTNSHTSAHANTTADIRNAIVNQLDGEVGILEGHQFPDGESYIRVKSECTSRDAIIVANLHQPNAKILPLIFLCETLRELGIRSITLVCPYLPYMRQDIVFKAGEGITSRFFSKLMSQYLDGLITIDPHLHRYNSLDEIYTLKSTVLQANPLIANWIKLNIEKPLVVGPDSESEQWAASAAEMIGCPYIILEKQRFGDREVQVSSPQAKRYQDLTPVLIDDIISTGQTMIKTAEALNADGLQAPVCIGVHALFSGDAYHAMLNANIARIITCNTVPHETNGIDITSLLAQACQTGLPA
jgi:ribose-phosphate pyrophosphokinase